MDKSCKSYQEYEWQRLEVNLEHEYYNGVRGRGYQRDQLRRSWWRIWWKRWRRFE